MLLNRLVGLLDIVDNCPESEESLVFALFGVGSDIIEVTEMFGKLPRNLGEWGNRGVHMPSNGDGYFPDR
jgi:hypothetical protein